MLAYRNLVRLAAFCAFASVAPALPAVASEDAPAAVRVERVKPKKEKLPTLRFLRTNLDFVRGRLDLLRERPLEQDSDGRSIDPRFLAYAQLVAGARAAGDSAAAIDRSVAARELFDHVGELAALEAELDAIGRLLADQQARLGRLQENFAARPTTSLSLLVVGMPATDAPHGLAWIREEGDTLRVSWSDAERASLRAGGTLEAFRGLVEPREQVLELACEGPGWEDAPHAWVTLDPERGRLTFLSIDCAAVTPASGATAAQATTWVLPRPEILGTNARP